MTSRGPRGLPLPGPRRLLFVCSGNICRSPLGEAIFRHLAGEAGLGGGFELDSAGTHGWHEGDPADPRTRRVGEKHGVRVTSIARAVRPSDFERFDLILAMDRGHLGELRSRCPAPYRDKIRLLREFEPEGQGRSGDDLDVPDPYYGGERAFEEVFRMLDRCCRRLLDELRA